MSDISMQYNVTYDHTM